MIIKDSVDPDTPSVEAAPLRSQISIKVGSLETGEVKPDETTIYSIGADNIERPTRDPFAERYEKDV